MKDEYTRLCELDGHDFDGAFGPDTCVVCDLTVTRPDLLARAEAAEAQRDALLNALDTPDEVDPVEWAGVLREVAAQAVIASEQGMGGQDLWRAAGKLEDVRNPPPPAPCPPPAVGQRWERGYARGHIDTVHDCEGLLVVWLSGEDMSPARYLGANDWAACRAVDRLLSDDGEVLWAGPQWHGGES